MPYAVVEDIVARLEIPENGTLSRVLYKDDRIRVVGFAFDEGQELTEHTAAVPAILQVLTGRFNVVLGDDELDLGPNAWVRMDAHLQHALRALEPGVLLLTLLR